MADIPQWAMKAAVRILALVSASPAQLKELTRYAKRPIASIIAAEHDAAENKP